MVPGSFHSGRGKLAVCENRTKSESEKLSRFSVRTNCSCFKVSITAGSHY